MLIIEKPKLREITNYNVEQLRRFERRNNIQTTGKAYLLSIIESHSKHYYKGWWYLVFSLKMRQKMGYAAKMVNSKISFANIPGGVGLQLNPTFWTRRQEGNFVCKTDNYAKAVDAILADRSKNFLECRGLCEVMVLRALQLAVGNTRFNKYLKDQLGSDPLELRLNSKLLQSEELSATGQTTVYKGDAIFRPGDLVAFSNNRKPAKGTQWLVENAVCVGWKNDAKGQPRFDEPLFVGGGVSKVLTEAEMKEVIYQQTPNSLVTGDRTRHFAEKAIGGPICTHRLDSDAENKGSNLAGTVPNIYLHTTVERIGVLGGRKDVY
ncbi:MAG: hypothetical protein ACFFCW_08530 [Candidatus Hodarchaeota archaeon]